MDTVIRSVSQPISNCDVRFCGVDRSLSFSGLTTLGLLLLNLSAAPAQGATLYSRNNLITNADVGFNGADVSQLPSNATTYGFTASSGLRLAQSFSVTDDSWTIDSIGVMAYLNSPAGAPTTSPFTGISINIWNQAPGASGAQTLAASTTLSSTAWTGIYRTPNGAANLTNSLRPIMSVTAAFDNLTLSRGTYWVDYAVSGTSTSGSNNAFTPYLLNSGSSTTIATGTARQFNGTSWSPIATTAANQGVSLPLTITGSRSTNAIPTPALLPGLIGFGVSLWRRRNGAPNP
jgi:hypothetical protein